MQGTTDLQGLERRFRRIYERARLKRALLGFLPTLVLVPAALALGGRAETAIVLVPLLFGAGVLALWYGREPGRGVFVGALGGTVALALALCANQMGHACAADRCLTDCFPACMPSGFVAGGVVSLVGLRQRRRAGYWASASGIALLTAALGNSCVGYWGILGLAAGFVPVALTSFATRS